MSHVVLLGDSIFDNAAYVPDRPAVIDQVRASLPEGWNVTLLAVDGHMVEDVLDQLKSLPAGATHLVVSAGGNDALSEVAILAEAACTVGDALVLMDEVRSRFRERYRRMLRVLAQTEKIVAVCTIYDAIPGLASAELTALAMINEVILREAIAAGVSILDLRVVCSSSSDYSHVSSIEPSSTGGAKIARLIADFAVGNPANPARSVVYI